MTISSDNISLDISFSHCLHIIRGEAIDKNLTDILWGTRTQYLAVFSRYEQPLSTTNHQLPQTSTRYPSAYVANTDPSSLSGEHWVAFYHLSPSHLEFFDSYGCPTDDYNIPIPPTITQIDINSHQIQSNNSSDCSQYCIFYLYQRAHGMPLPEINKVLRMTSNPDLFVRTFHSKLRSHISLCSRTISLLSFLLSSAILHTETPLK